MRIITTRSEFKALATELGVRPDWHEPDEQGVTAQVRGRSFDNAGFWPVRDGYLASIVEKHVIISKDGEAVAAVNLATLCAWASGLDD